MKNFMLIALFTATIFGAQCQPVQPPRGEDEVKQGVTMLRHAPPSAGERMEMKRAEPAVGTISEEEEQDVPMVTLNPESSEMKQLDDYVSSLPRVIPNPLEYGEDVTEETGRRSPRTSALGDLRGVLERLERIDGNLRSLRISVEHFGQDFDDIYSYFEEAKSQLDAHIYAVERGNADANNRENRRREAMTTDDIEDLRRQLHAPEIQTRKNIGQDKRVESRGSTRTAAGDEDEDPLSKVDEVLEGNCGAVTLHFKRADDFVDSESAHVIEYKSFMEKLVSIEPYFNGDADIDRRVAYARGLLELIFNPSFQIKVIPSSELPSDYSWGFSEENAEEGAAMSLVYETIEAAQRMFSGTVGWIKTCLARQASLRDNTLVQTTYALLHQVGNILNYLADQEEVEEALCSDCAARQAEEDACVEPPFAATSMPLLYKEAETSESTEPKSEGADGTGASV